MLPSFYFLQISPEKFQEAFGAPIESAMDLLACKALSISKLMVLAPPGTLDPAPHLYNSTMYTLGGLMALAYVSQSLVRPVAALPAPSAEAVAAMAKATQGAQVVDTTGAVLSDKTETLAGDRLVK